MGLEGGHADVAVGVAQACTNPVWLTAGGAADRSASVAASSVKCNDMLRLMVDEATTIHQQRGAQAAK